MSGAPAVTQYRVVELIPNGSKIPVTNDNRKRYVDLYVDYRLHSGVKAQSDAFLNGFKAACGGATLNLFTARELEQLICGVMPVRPIRPQYFGRRFSMWCSFSL